MTEPSDNYWDDLGVAWRAIEVDVDVVAPRLRSRLRRQSLLIRSALVLGVPLASCGIVLGALTVWWGLTSSTWNFVTRGIAIGVIGAVALKALLSFASLRDSGNAHTLTDMLDLAVRRARTTLTLIQGALFACAIAAVLGSIGAFLRTRAGGPPALSPIVDVVVLVLTAVILVAYRRRTHDTLLKLRYLMQVMPPDSSQPTRHP